MRKTDKVVFADEPTTPSDQPSSSEPWHIIVADDEGMVHMITEMALKDYAFEGRGLEIHSAYSAKQMLKIMAELPSKVAVILLDVVMESLEAGLQAVPLIRDELHDREVRIVIRTGQAGRTAVSDIIRTYDINDFHEKTHLDHNKLINVVTLALRNYRDILHANKQES